jgi:hypothetical protein
VVEKSGTHAPVHGERGGGRTDRAGPRHRERRKGVRGATARRLVIWARETGREGARGEENCRRQAGPTRQRAREGGRGRGRIVADRRGPPVRRRGRAALLSRLGWFGLLSLFLFL